MNDISTLVSTLGYPIVVSGCIGVFIYKAWEKATVSNEKREDRYLNTIDKFGDSLDRINQTMVTMDKRLEYLEKDKEVK